MTDVNGWANFETWTVALAINDDEGWQARVEAMTLEAFHEEWSTTGDTDEDALRSGATTHLADALEEGFTSANPLAGDGTPWGTLLAAALREVRWHEIAASFVEAAVEEGHAP